VAALLLHFAGCRNDELQVAAYLAQLRRQQQQHGLLQSAEAAVAGGVVVVPAGAVLQGAANSSGSGCVASAALGVMHGV
jgi:hypothetical protein